MKPTTPSEPKAGTASPTGNGPKPPPLRLSVTLGQAVPSKKNHHFPLANGGLGIDKAIKLRMNDLENGILSALCSESQMTASETPLECLRRLQTLLSGLLDDSIREIPTGSWGVEYVPKGQEGVIIEITPLD